MTYILVWRYNGRVNTEFWRDLADAIWRRDKLELFWHTDVTLHYRGDR